MATIAKVRVPPAARPLLPVGDLFYFAGLVIFGQLGARSFTGGVAADLGPRNRIRRDRP